MLVKSTLLPYFTGKKTGFQCVREAAQLPTETPIKLTSNLDKREHSSYPNTLTSQQDVSDDEDEGDVDSAKKQFYETNVAQQGNSTNCAQENENSAEGGKLIATDVRGHEAIIRAAIVAMHVFKLSLPRDIHTQAQRKLLQSINTPSTLPKEPSHSTNSTAGSSSKPISFSSKCCCLNNRMRIQQCLPLALDDALLHENNCPLHYGNEIVISGSEPLSNLSDNWVLHKVKSSESEAVNTCRFSSDARYRKWNTVASVDPISSSYVTTGKHVMYLPSKEPNATTACNAVTCRTIMQKGEQYQYK